MKFLSALALFLTACEAAGRKPWVSEKKFVKDVSIKKLMKRAYELQHIADRHGGNRKWASAGHWETVHWIDRNLRPLNYYDIQWQYFNISVSKYDKIEVTGTNGSPLAVDTRGFMGGTNGTISGHVVHVPNSGCAMTDFDPSIKGGIALIQRGGICRDGQKNANAKNAGAVGVIQYNNNSTMPDPPRLGLPYRFKIDEFLISAFIDRPSGEALAKKVQGGAKVSATIVSVVHGIDVLTANLCAETKGGNHNQVISTGAHSDSVKFGAGINDDGSGTISQLEMAIALSKYRVKNAVRWCWWSAEEDGLLGSLYYTRTLPPSEVDKLVLNMDYDMLASDNFVLGVYDGDGSVFGKEFSGPEGSGHLEQTYVDFFHSIGKKTVSKQFNGRSDYVGFIDIGVPAGGIATGAEVLKTPDEAKWFGGKAGKPHDQCYHLKCDTVENLSKEGWTMMTQALAHSIAKYAMDISDFPFPREKSKKPLIKREHVMNERGSMVPDDMHACHDHDEL